MHLGHIDWGYSESDDTRTRWLVQCATRATARARQIAEALGVRVLGVHHFGEPDFQVAASHLESLGAPVPGMSRARMSAEDLGLTVAHSKKVVVRALVEFRIGPRE